MQICVHFGTSIYNWIINWIFEKANKYNEYNLPALQCTHTLHNVYYFRDRTVQNSSTFWKNILRLQNCS
jgi:hypothetical protein